MKRLLLLLSLALGIHTATADPIIPPPIINYQGRVMQNGVNFNGTGQFKFMLVNKTPGIATERIVWKNDGSLVTGEPSVAVSLTVTDGHFSVGLGDTDITNMHRELPAGAFGPPPGVGDLTALELRIWFRPGSTGTFAQFTPDVRIQSVPFAFSARTVGGVEADQIITKGSAQEITQSTAGVATLSPTFTGAISVQHGVAGLTHMRGPIRVAAGNTWRLAVLSATDSAISFFDFTDGPDALPRSGVVVDGTGGFNRLSGPSDMFSVGDRVYVTSSAESALSILDFNGTTNTATLRLELTDGTGAFTRLDGASCVTAWTSNSSSTIAAVGSSGQNAITLMDVTTPASPVLLSVIDATALNLTGFSAPSSLLVLDRPLSSALGEATTLYATCPLTNALFAFDVTNPALPSLLWSRTSTSLGYSSMNGPARFAQNNSGSSATAIGVICPAGNSVILVDPDTGAARSSIVHGANGFTSLQSPQGALIESDSFDAYIAIAASGSNALTIVDTSDPANPKPVTVLQDGAAPLNLLGGCFDVARTSPSGGGAIRLAMLGRTDNALTLTNTIPLNRFRSLTTNHDFGAGTRRPHTRIEAFESSNCAIRAATSASGDARLQLVEYDPTSDETPFGYEWFYDGGADTLKLDAIGFAGNTGTKATFTKTGNLTLQGTLTQSSDRARKENIVPADSAAILEKVAALPVAEWSYIGEDGVRHLGPMAQDFRAAFQLGDTDKGIAAVDADGVALAAIQALKAEMDALKKENAALRTRLERVEGR